MMYTVKRIDEDLNFGCEERPDEVPVMAIVTLCGLFRKKPMRIAR